MTRNDPLFNPDVSEEHICWETSPDMGGTGGGWGQSVLNYFTSHGVVSETECPYQASSPDVGIAPYWPLNTDWESRVWKSVSNANSFSTDTATIKAWLKSCGPLEVGCLSWNDLFNTPAELIANYRGPVNSGDHEVSLVGYYDNASVPSGGYWVIKNSWGTGAGDNGYYYVPYGDLEIHNDISALTGAVSYSGPMYHTGAWDASGVDHTGNDATNTWKGTSSNLWNTSSGTSGNWSNNGTGQAFTWVNQELQAVFDATGGNRAITVSGTVIAHGLTVSSTGYSFAPADSNSKLTITAGGVTTSEDLTLSTPVYIGGPQSWNVASGKTLTVSGALHTVVSDLTFSGAGNTVISGAIDGGGVLNTYGGAKPGGLIQTGTGTLTLSNVSGYTGDITANTGSGTLYLSPTGGGSLVLGGGLIGGGSVSFSGSSLTLGVDDSNFSGTLTFTQPCDLTFAPGAGVSSTFSCRISNDGSVTQDGPGTTVFPNRSSNLNNYTGGTTISNGILQANSGNGLPSTSFLTLDGGILQSYGSSSITFNRSLGTSGGTFLWTTNGGGFSAGTGAMYISIPGGALTWSSDPADAGSKILGTLKLSSATASSATTFYNAVNLGGADRTIHVDDNPATLSDYAAMAGSITGEGGLVKSGDGWLKLNVSNSYTGDTTIGGGELQATLGMGIPANSFLRLDGGVLQLNTTSFTRSLGTSGATFEWASGGGGFSAGSSALTVNIGNDGHTLTWGADVGTQIVGTLRLNAVTASNSLTFVNGIDLNGGARTIAADANSVYLSGGISDGIGGGSLTKTGTATLYLTGSSGNTYTGLTTILGGNVYLNKSSGYAIPGNLTLGGNTQIFLHVQGNNQIAPTSKWSWMGTGAWQEIELMGHSQTIAGLVDNTGQGVVESTWDESGYGALTLTINNSTDCSFNGTLRTTWAGSTGALSVVKTGAGVQTLSGGNIYYTGGTTISEGKLVFQDLTNTTFSSRAVTDNATLELSAAHSDFTFNGRISGSGSLIKSGGARVTLGGSGGNTYSGSTTITYGALVLAKTSGYAIPGDFTLVDDPAFVIVQNANQFPPTAKVTFSGSGNPHLEVYGNVVTVGGISTTSGTGGEIENTEGETGVGNGTIVVNNTQDCTYAGTIRNTAWGSGTIALVKTGSGKLTLVGNDVGSYTGGLTVNDGTLDYSGGTLPACNYTITGGTLNIGSRSKSIGTFQITGGTVSGAGTLTSNATYDVQAGTINTRLGGSGIALTKTGIGTVILNGSNTYTGATTISAGTLQLGTGSSTGSLSSSSNVVIDANGTFDVNRSSPVSFNGKVSGTGTLVKDGSGILTLSGANTFSGNITLNNGTLNYSSNSILPSGNYTIAGGTLNTGTLSQSIGTFQITNGIVSGTGTLTSNAAYDIQAGTVGPILAGNVGLNKTGDGSATLGRHPAYTGTTSVQAGTLTFSAGLPGGDYTISGGTLDTDSLSGSIGTFQITGGTVSGTGTLTSGSDYDVQAGAVNAVLAGGVGLVKTQDGIATLRGSNLYTGVTRIEAGTLALAEGGQIDPQSVIDNDATFLIADGSESHTVGTIAGMGSTVLSNSAQLSTSSITQQSLIIGSDARLTIAPPPDGQGGGMGVAAGHAVPVPEPETWFLFASLGTTLIAAFFRKIRHVFSVD